VRRACRNLGPHRALPVRSQIVLAGTLAANVYRHRPRTTEDIDFLVGDEAFQTHPDGSVTMRVPVIEFDGIERLFGNVDRAR
jgi:hypothetical protein